MLTQEQLKAELEYNQETGHFIRRRGPRKGKRAGAVIKNGYRSILIGGHGDRLYYEHRLAFLYMCGHWPPNDVDHINRNRADNRFDNLRFATRSENNRNTGIYRHNKSGIRGVSLHAPTQKWCANIQHNSKSIYLGLFSSKEEAARARRSAEAMIWKEWVA